MEEYIIRGGLKGRERLRILSRVLQPTTLALLKQAGVRSGSSCLDLGCGGGDVSFQLASLVGPEGKVVGMDMDATKIEMARNEAAENNLHYVEFIADNIFNVEIDPSFDFVYARFLLTHLKDPQSMLEFAYHHLRPGGVVILEDIDFKGHFSFPENFSFDRYVRLYSEVSIKNGGDPFIGPKLPGLLLDTGFENVKMNTVQPSGIEGEVKLIAPITMENITPSVIKAGLASEEEIHHIMMELNGIARDNKTIISMPRIFQVWAYRS